MTSICLSTSARTTDDEFDPDARQVGSDGLTYVDFFDALTEKPDPLDPCNAEIQRLRAQGRSEAFCREYRVGYDGAKTATLIVAEDKAGCEYWAAGEIVSHSEYLARRAGHLRAHEAFPDHQDEETANSAQCRLRTAGLARATKLHGECRRA